MARFLHTADLQLGMPFCGIPDPDARASARKARLESVDHIGEAARREKASFVVVAGDLFDANTVDQRTVREARDRLAGIGLPTYILPGNHDHGGADSVYRSGAFTQQCPPNVTVLLDSNPRVVSEGEAVLLPAPLLRRHNEDPTRHLTAELGRDLAPGAVRVGVAHGSVSDFGQSIAEGNRLDPALAEKADLDYLALGDWHGAKQISPRTWYAGAPEPTGFKDNNPGRVLLVDIPGRGELPEVSELPVARTRWLRHEAVLDSLERLDELERFLSGLENRRNTALRLELSGVLPLEACRRLEGILQEAEHGLLYLRLRGQGVLPAPTPAELSELATEGYVRTAVERLGAMPSDEARRALHLLWRLRHAGA